LFGNLPFPRLLRTLISDAVQSDAGAAGYTAAHGAPAAREAVAAYTNRQGWSASNAAVNGNDVVIASGCSHALQIALHALCDAGDNVLLPRPGFSVYQTICEHVGIAVKYYDLDPQRDWQVDLASLANAVDSRTRAILVNNPSNPCGSVYSREHLLDILRVAEQRRLPIIADEVYAGMVFSGTAFHALASLSTNVPVLSCGGLAKVFLVPGWRVGWLVLHDRHDILKRGRVYEGTARLSQILIGANTLVQATLPRLLVETPAEFFSTTMHTLEHNAKVSLEALASVPALKPTVPRGAMYLMVGIDVAALDIANDLEFCEKLYQEESVLVLPGQCFKVPNFFRVVLCPPPNQLQDAFARMREFCARHTKKQ
jgi:tyrosine aminotransferase